MEPLFDAFESLPSTVSVLEREFERADQKTRRRILCCIAYLGIPKGQNRRNVVGKHYTEIERDHEHFKALASRATLLKHGQ